MSGAPATYTQKGIAAVKAGNRRLAQQFLNTALAENPNDATAWLWLSSVVGTLEEKRACLKRVLAIDPQHAAARRGLELLGPEPRTLFAEEPLAPQAPPLPIEPAPLAPRSTPASRPVPRRGLTLILAVLIIGVLGVFGLIVALLADRTETPAVAVSQATPVATATRPPTWTPTPTGTPAPRPTPRPAPTQLQPLVEEAVRVRALAPIESIHYVLSAQFDLDLYLRNDLDAQSVVLANTFWDEVQALGLVDFDVEYDRQQIIDATSRQLGGFYSTADKTLYAVTQSSRIEPNEYAVIVHEYVHALTDMHFDLSRLYRSGQATTDADLAARALGEGDATLAENSSRWGNYESDGWAEYAQDARWAVPLLRQSGVSPALLFIQSFPYVEGWEFAWNLRESGGWDRVNQAYTNIPASTEQILHPDKYLAAADPPRALALPDSAASAWSDYTLVVENDTLGEFVLSLVLDDFIDDPPRAIQAAAGWGGDVLRVWTDQSDQWVYVLLTAWDSEEDAREFQQAAGEMLAQRAEVQPSSVENDRAYFDADQVAAYLSRRLDEVLIIWCPEPAIRDELLAAFPDF
ncbi:MAG TPA: hypothetical protein VJG32_10455 [Anaerolineae bacterium]|nr:hypothetical protein [Anaerolineae bacterium]